MLAREEVINRYETYQKLNSMRATAKVFNVTYQAISLLFQYYNLPVKPRGFNNHSRIYSKQDKIKDEVLKLFPELSIKQLAKQFNVCDETIRNVLRNANVSMKRYILSPTQEQKVCSLYYKLGVLKLGKMFGITHTAILGCLRRHNVKILPRGRCSHRNI